jgi:hypothetical protein
MCQHLRVNKWQSVKFWMENRRKYHIRIFSKPKYHLVSAMRIEIEVPKIKIFKPYVPKMFLTQLLICGKFASSFETIP